MGEGNRITSIRVVYSSNNIHNIIFAGHSHVAVVDLDEIIVPEEDITLTELITLMEAKYSVPGRAIGSLCAQHVLVDNDHTNNTRALMISTRTQRTERPHPEGTVRSKCIHRTRYVDTTDIHTAKWFTRRALQQVHCPLHVCIYTVTGNPLLH